MNARQLAEVAEIASAGELTGADVIVRPPATLIRSLRLRWETRACASAAGLPLSLPPSR
jgi:hypothetical protein